MLVSLLILSMATAGEPEPEPTPVGKVLTPEFLATIPSGPLPPTCSYRRTDGWCVQRAWHRWHSRKDRDHPGALLSSMWTDAPAQVRGRGPDPAKPYPTVSEDFVLPEGRTWQDGVPDVLTGRRDVAHVLAQVPGAQRGRIAGDRPALLIDGWSVGGVDGLLGLADVWQGPRR